MSTTTTKDADRLIDRAARALIRYDGHDPDDPDLAIGTYRARARAVLRALGWSDPHQSTPVWMRDQSVDGLARNVMPDPEWCLIQSGADRALAWTTEPSDA